MFAYGTGECPPVDVITGPGNVYGRRGPSAIPGGHRRQPTAKNGPTEIGIIADHTADPAYPRRRP